MRRSYVRMAAPVSGLMKPMTHPRSGRSSTGLISITTSHVKKTARTSSDSILSRLVPRERLWITGQTQHRAACVTVRCMGSATTNRGADGRHWRQAVYFARFISNKLLQRRQFIVFNVVCWSFLANVLQKRFLFIPMTSL